MLHATPPATPPPNKTHCSRWGGNMADRATLLSMVAYFEKRAKKERCVCGVRIARELRNLVEEAAIEDLMRLLSK